MVDSRAPQRVCNVHFVVINFFAAKQKSSAPRNAATTTLVLYQPISVLCAVRCAVCGVRMACADVPPPKEFIVLLYIVISCMHAATTAGMYYMNFNDFRAKLYVFFRFGHLTQMPLNVFTSHSMMEVHFHNQREEKTK